MDDILSSQLHPQAYKWKWQGEAYKMWSYYYAVFFPNQKTTSTHRPTIRKSYELLCAVLCGIKQLRLCFQWCCVTCLSDYIASYFNSLRPRRNGRNFPDNTFKCFFLNENAWISIKSSLKFVPKGLINNIPALVQIMAWRRPGHKPLSEPMMFSLPTHICVTQSQWLMGSNLTIFEQNPHIPVVLPYNDVAS